MNHPHSKLRWVPTLLAFSAGGWGLFFCNWPRPVQSTCVTATSRFALDSVPLRINTVSMRNTFIKALLLCAVATPSFGQDRVFNWVPANDETVQMDPADYHTGRVYRPAPGGGNIHVDISARREPVTIAMTWADEWNNALQHPEAFAN